MIYVYAPNQALVRFPYSIGALQRDNPNTSFPRNPSEETLAAWNVYPVIDRPAPSYDPATQNCSQVDPVLEAGEWVTAWSVTSATPEQITERTEEKAAEVRLDRNNRLSNCDWTQLPDAPVSQAAWVTYRQELRDLTSQSGFPWNPIWPSQPS